MRRSAKIAKRYADPMSNKTGELGSRRAGRMTPPGSRKVGVALR